MPPVNVIATMALVTVKVVRAHAKVSLPPAVTLVLVLAAPAPLSQTDVTVAPVIAKVGPTGVGQAPPFIEYTTPQAEPMGKIVVLENVIEVGVSVTLDIQAEALPDVEIGTPVVPK